MKLSSLHFDFEVEGLQYEREHLLSWTVNVTGFDALTLNGQTHNSISSFSEAVDDKTYDEVMRALNEYAQNEFNRMMYHEMKERNAFYNPAD